MLSSVIKRPVNLVNKVLKQQSSFGTLKSKMFDSSYSKNVFLFVMF
jgi:hypothetical protein